MPAKPTPQEAEALGEIATSLYKVGKLDFRAYRDLLIEIGRTDMIRDPTTGADVRLFRRKFGLSQAQLAAKLRVSLSAVTKWEAAKEKPIPPLVSAFLGVLDRNGLEILDV